MLHRISAVRPAFRAGVNHREAMVCFLTNQEHYRTDPFVAAAEMTVEIIELDHVLRRRSLALPHPGKIGRKSSWMSRTSGFSRLRSAAEASAAMINSRTRRTPESYHSRALRR